MIDDWKLVICYWEDKDGIGISDSNHQFPSCVGQDLIQYSVLRGCECNHLGRQVTNIWANWVF